MIANMIETIGKLVGPPDSEDEATVYLEQCEHDVDNKHRENKDETSQVQRIAEMINDGRRNSTDDWIEFVYSFAKQIDDEMLREADSKELFRDKNTFRERVQKCGKAIIKQNTGDRMMQKMKETLLFHNSDDAEEENNHSPRAHPLASTSSGKTFQWPTARSGNTGEQSRGKALLDTPNVEFPENSMERNVVLKEIIKLLRIKRPNSTENWHKACPSLAPRLESMLYEYAPNLSAYKDLSTLTERVLQWVSLGGFKKPFQIKTVKSVEAPPLTTVPLRAEDVKLTAPFSGTVSDFPTPSAYASAHMPNKKGSTPAKSRAKLSKSSPQLDEKPTQKAVEKVTVADKTTVGKTTENVETPLEVVPPKKLPPAPKDLLKLQQQRLLLLQHVAKCPHGEGLCPVTPHCWSMKKLWEHVKHCSLVKCSTPHCVSSRYVLSHWCNCVDQTCRMCKPAREGVDGSLKQLAEAEQDSTAQQTSMKRKAGDSDVGTKENIVNFGDLSGPAAKRRLAAAGSEHISPTAGSVHSGTSLHSRQSQLSHQSHQSGRGLRHASEWIQLLFTPVIDELLRVPGAQLFFGQPVDPTALGLSNYFEVVKHPMDLGTVRQTLEMRHYRKLQDLVDDVHQTFDNAKQYNRTGTEVHNLAKKLRTVFSDISRKPRLELASKLTELQAAKESRKMTSNPSTAPSISIYEDTTGPGKGLSVAIP